MTKMSPQKLTLYNVEWQALRVSLLGSWTTPKGTAKNLERLVNYLERQHMTTSALWRVLNLLNAVRMGYSGQGKRNSEEDRLVVTIRNKVAKAYHHNKNKVFEVPTRKEITAAWSKLTSVQRVAIYVNLKQRLENGSTEHRRELAWFIKIIEEVIDVDTTSQP